MLEKLMPPGSLATHRLLAVELVSTPITADTLPTLLKLFHGSLVMLTNDLIHAVVLRELEEDAPA